MALEDTSYENTKFCTVHQEYTAREFGLVFCRSCHLDDSRKNFEELRRQAVLRLIKKLMTDQDAATYHGDQSGMSEKAERTVNQIIKLFRA